MWTHSIRRQLILGIALVHALLMTIFVFDLVNRESNFLREQTIAQTTSLAETLAANSTSWVLSSDIVGLEEVIRSQSKYPGLIYAMVVNKDGRILGHTSSELIGKYLSDPISISMVESLPGEIVLVDNDRLIDIAVPVYANRQYIGWARVGISQEHVSSGLQAITRDGLIYTLIAISIGTLFALFMARGLTLGLQRIVAVAEKVTHGEHNIRSHLQRSDELGILSRDFDLMLDALQSREEQLKQTQEELSASEQRFDLAMRGANDGLWDWDILDDSVYYSPRWLEMLGYRPGELDSKHQVWSERVHPDDLPSAEFDIQLHLDGKTPLYENIHRVMHKDGEYRWHLERGIAVRNENGQVYRMVGTNTDITERIQAQQALELAKQELEQRVVERTEALAEALLRAQEASQTKSLFLANMSHEIRTPMNGIFGMLNLLRETRLDGNQKDLLETAFNSAETLLTILNDILDFSKIEAGRLELEKIDFAINDTLEDVATLFAQKSGEKGVELINDIDTTLPHFVLGDPTRLRQVLSNLISNAIKFTRSGEIVIKSKLLDKTSNNAVVYFEVRDTGIGIPEDKLEHIFDAFSQVDGSTTRRFGGTGLGLTISSQLAKLMGGEIGCSSKEGTGSVFWFTCTFDNSEFDVPMYNPGDVLKNQRILIVDDNATNRIILEKQLHAWGVTELDSAIDGPNALEILQDNRDSNPYTIVLLDMMMPDMDGIQLADAISAACGEQRPHLIMLTSMSGTHSRLSLQQHNIEVCLSKPIRQSVLYDTLINIASKTSAREATRYNPSAGSRTAKPLSDISQILLVEDNRVNLKVAIGYLYALGLEADTASDGHEALSRVGEKDYDIIFMDCQMPGMDGFEATAAIRKLEGQRRHTPIVAVTANAMVGDREKCYAVGMDDYIAKPYTIDEIREMLNKWAPELLKTAQPPGRA